MGHYTGDLKCISKTIRLTEKENDYIEAFPGSNFNRKLANFIQACMEGEKELIDKSMEVEQLVKEVKQLENLKAELSKDIRLQLYQNKKLLNHMSAFILQFEEKYYSKSGQANIQYSESAGA